MAFRRTLQVGFTVSRAAKGVNWNGLRSLCRVAHQADQLVFKPPCAWHPLPGGNTFRFFEGSASLPWCNGLWGGLVLSLTLPLLPSAGTSPVDFRGVPNSCAICEI